MLNGCLQLRELLLATEKGYKMNPICSTSINLFNILPQLLILDERNSQGEKESTLYEDPTIAMFDSLLDSNIATPPRRKEPFISNSPFENMIPFENEEFNAIRQYARTPVEHKLPKVEVNRHSPRPIIIENNNGEVLAKMLQLQEQIQTLAQKTMNNKEAEKISVLEKQIQSLTVAVSLEKAAKTSTPKVERVIQTEIIEDQKTAERFQQLEKQINNLFDFVKEGEKKKQDKEKNRVLKELPVNIQVSPATSDEFIHIPTKLPKRKTKNQSLVWLEDDSDELAENTRQTPPKKFLKLGQNQVKTSSKLPNITANLKLITVLEAEQRRLRENEQRYAEKIKELNTEVSALKSAAKELAEIKIDYTDLVIFANVQKMKYETVKSTLADYKRISLEKERELENSMAHSKNLSIQNEDYQGLVEKLEIKNKELLSNCDIFQQQVSELRTDLTKVEMVNQKNELALEKTTSQLKSIQSENSKLSVRVIKERETFKVRCAELKAEKQQLLESIEKGEREITFLKNNLNHKEDNFRDNVESLIQSHKNEMAAAIANAVNQESEKQSYLTESLRKQLTMLQEAYKALETEFLTSVKRIEGLILGERKKSLLLEEKLKDAAQRNDESYKTIETLEKKTKEQTDTIAELVKMVKELKANFDFLQEKERNSTQLYHSSIQRFDENASKLQQEINAKQKIQQNLVEETSKEQLLHERDRQIKILENALQEMQIKYGNFEDVVKVKESMLQDQNDTIKTLKMNLENKTREYQNLKKELEQSHEYLQEYEEKDKAEYHEMQEQLREYKENQDSYRAMAQDYKAERDDLRQEIVALTEKLNQRNSSIELIEKEVEKVKKSFEMKQQALVENHKIELQELEKKYTVELSEISYYKSEKESLIHQLKQAQSLLQKCTHQKDDIEKELKFVLTEMDRQKKTLEAKMAKLLATVKELRFLSNAQKAREKIAQVDSKSPLPLTDLFNRQHTYLRISLTEKCNLRCTYCMPEEGVELTPKQNLLTFEEILRLGRIFVENGINKIRLTGGEPTIRKDLIDIVAGLNELKRIGLKKVGITTNGIALKRKLVPLKEAGLDQINISLDTLDPLKFELMTRRRGHETVLGAMRSALDLNFDSVKLNVVVINKVNQMEIIDFVNMTKDLPIYIRFIEYMPFDGNKWNTEKFISYQDMLQLIRNVHPDIMKEMDDPNDTSKAYRVPGFKGKFGFITSMSDNFCGTCNRLRVLADGNMKVCLFGNAEVNLKQLMRDGITSTELVDVISSADSKPVHNMFDVTEELEDIGGPSIMLTRPTVKKNDRVIPAQTVPFYETDLNNINVSNNHSPLDELFDHHSPRSPGLDLAQTAALNNRRVSQDILDLQMGNNAVSTAQQTSPFAQTANQFNMQDTTLQSSPFAQPVTSPFQPANQFAGQSPYQYANDFSQYAHQSPFAQPLNQFTQSSPFQQSNHFNHSPMQQVNSFVQMQNGYHQSPLSVVNENLSNTSPFYQSSHFSQHGSPFVTNLNSSLTPQLAYLNVLNQNNNQYSPQSNGNQFSQQSYEGVYDDGLSNNFDFVANTLDIEAIPTEVNVQAILDPSAGSTLTSSEPLQVKEIVFDQLQRKDINGEEHVKCPNSYWYKKQFHLEKHFATCKPTESAKKPKSTHLNSSNSNSTCEICGHNFSRRDALIRHLKGKKNACIIQMEINKKLKEQK
ncbi:Molybdenum cofactor synthesis protein 1 [Boothiomyces sp. JEL0866]|nr:Molybdenum cofactor synthesis protein 1 [Boothiomyces sp. JEL0866]